MSYKIYSILIFKYGVQIVHLWDIFVLYPYIQVSPPYDTTGTTALTAANLLFEMLSVLPGVIYK